ncbi:MAG: hypothetical protein PHW41_04250 [Eubacteriales bacterium]|nr:hypothetical protein [Eubacteriales bacterium]
MREANAQNRNAYPISPRAAKAGRLISRAAFARVNAGLAMRMRKHAEQADAVAAAL